jgi:hypothetical protein
MVASRPSSAAFMNATSYALKEMNSTVEPQH